MAAIDKEALNELCNKVNLLEYAEETLDFEMVNSDSYAAHCPRHIDKTPSLKITPSKNAFHCFSCGCGGGIISWMMTFEQMNFNQAVDKISKITGTDCRHLKICNSVAYYKELKRISEAKKPEQLERKILSQDYYEQFSAELPQEWIDEGIPEDELRKYEIRIDHKSNRIVYPVYDKDFNLIGAKGRTRFPNWKELRIPSKYMNYTKIQTTDYFTGMKQAIASIREKKQVIIVEGIKSVMKIDSYGYHNCVSAETSSLNEQQIILLIQLGINEVVIAFDEDVKLKKIQDSTKLLRRYTNVSVVSDKRREFLDPKDSPCDKGREVWDRLYNERTRI